MLEKLKIYFSIEDDSQDALLMEIIEQDSNLCETLGINKNCLFPMCVEDYSNYLQSGNSMFTVSMTTKGLNRYSKELRDTLKMSIQAKVFG